jgi:NAD(P)-dependent dehydrogenase (short-subunit alcohol dehydrogenase family)
MVYAREGASVLLVDLNIEAAQDTKRRIDAEGGICSVFEADVSNARDCQAMAEARLKLYGKIDILHNNVGIVKFGGLLEAEEEDWDRTMDVNVKGMFLTCKAVVPQMLKQGDGSIVNISSVAAVLPKFPEELMFLQAMIYQAPTCRFQIAATQTGQSPPAFVRIKYIQPEISLRQVLP